MNDLPYNGMLEIVPSDQIKANNYSELLSWKEQQCIFMGDGRQSPEEFWKWDKTVQELLTLAERVFSFRPPRQECSS